MDRGLCLTDRQSVTPAAFKSGSVRGERGRATLVQERSKVPSVPALKSKDFSVKFITRFRSSTVRSDIERFPIFSSVASVLRVTRDPRTRVRAQGVASGRDREDQVPHTRVGAQTPDQHPAPVVQGPVGQPPVVLSLRAILHQELEFKGGNGEFLTTCQEMLETVGLAESHRWEPPRRLSLWNMMGLGTLRWPALRVNRGSFMRSVGADDATYSSEKPNIAIRPASSFMNSQFDITPSLKGTDIHLITSSSATNTFDLPLMSNVPSLPKDPYDATDVEENVCSDFSSFIIDKEKKSHATYEKSRELSPSQTNGKSVISADDVIISRQTSDLRLETQDQGIQDTTPEMEDDLLSFNAQRHRDPEVILEKSHSSSPSISLHPSGQLKGYSSQFANGVGPIRANMQTFDQRVDSVLQPSSIGELPNGYPENPFSCAGKYLGSTDDTYYLSNESKRMHLNRFEGETATADHSTTADRGENNIISNILSMDFDPWNESLASQNLVKLLGETNNQQGSRVSNSRIVQSSNQSRFSFAREEDPMNASADSRPSLSYIDRSYSHRPLDQEFQNSRSYQLDDFGTRNGFSLFNNQESNGFANSYSHLSSNKQSGTHMLDTTSLLRNEYPSIGNVNNGDIEFMDPAILAVGKGRVQNGLNGSSLDMSPSFPPQPSGFENEARFQFLMQRSLSLHQNQRYTDNRDNFFNDAYGISSRVVEQTLANNLSPFSQLNLPQGRNSVMSNGQWDGWNGVPSGNDVGMAELLRNERLGYNKLFNGYEEPKFRMSNSGELYNRTFGI
ncbi:hypothetical protein KY290_009225 [Solanum tuberosum]|uniref:Uncharacterized protein n=1 Tax=Solanum tuberosum TaxID=4113 RepID=A0ABQ7WAN3_SOLTU|nr:hypothetical protein KY290_009225 [Solanum tuberosum]